MEKPTTTQTTTTTTTVTTTTVTTTTVETARPGTVRAFDEATERISVMVKDYGWVEAEDTFGDPWIVFPGLYQAVPFEERGETVP